MGNATHGQHIEQALEIASRTRLPSWVAPACVALAIVCGVIAVLTIAGSPEVALWVGLTAATLGVAAGVLSVWRTRRLNNATSMLVALARTDAESGLLAPHALWHDLTRHMSRARATNQPLCVVMVAVDELRALHLERGLAAGQLMLRQIGQALEATAGSHGGHCYRAHGESFVAVLPNTTHAEAERVARKIAPVLQLLERKNGGLIDLSAGAAIALAGDLPEDVVQRAERRSQRVRAGLSDELAQVMRPLSTH